MSAPNNKFIHNLKQNIMTTQDKVQAINEWNDQNGYADDTIYDFDEHTINDMFSNAWSIVQAISFGNVSYVHGYFRFNGYGNIETLSDWEIDDLYNEIPNEDEEE